MKGLDFSHGSGNLWLSLSAGVPSTLGRVSGPRLKGFDPTNDFLSQFDEPARSRITVALGHCVTPGKTNGPHTFADSQGWRNPGNGLVLDPALPYVPVIENKPYLAIREKD